MKQVKFVKERLDVILQVSLRLAGKYFRCEYSL